MTPLSSKNYRYYEIYPCEPILKTTEQTTSVSQCKLEISSDYDQEELFRLLLGSKKIMETEENTIDLEAYLAKELQRAKAEASFEEQVIYLVKLSDLYLSKKDWTRAAKILNCALAIFQNNLNHPDFEQFLFYRLEEIEALFLESQGIPTVYKHQDSVITYRSWLKRIRSCILEHQKQQFDIKKLLADLTLSYQEFLAALILNSQKLIGLPPVKWACLGLGSMARSEMCPYSDIEFAFLIEKETPENLQYFLLLTQLIELKIINLGETKFSIFGEGNDSPTPDGFCLDVGGITPYGNRDTYQLIGTPQSLARFQQQEWIEENIIVSNAMGSACLVVGDTGLFEKYQTKKNAILDEKISLFGQFHRKSFALRLLKGHTAEFSPDISKEKEELSAFGIKKELYRPFQEIIASLTLFYNLKAINTFGRIDELAGMGIFSTEGASNLKKAIAQVLTLRLEVHLFYCDEKEFLCHPEKDKPLDPHFMYFDEKTLKTLHEIYQVLIPFHQCGEKFLNSQSKQAFSSSHFYDECSTIQGAEFDKNLQYAKTQKMRQQAISLTPNQNLLHLAAQKGHGENVICLLKEEASINAKDLSNKTALFLAVLQGHREVVQILLQNKADPCIVSIEQETVLHAAAYYGYTQILDDLLKNPNCKQLIHTKDQDGKTPLHKAVWSSSKPDVVTLLLAHGAEVNTTNNYGYTPLHWAAKHGHSVSAEILLKNGAKIDLVNANGDLPFDLAIRHGSDDFIHFFLQTSQRMQKKEMHVKDIEGYHYKLLLEAKKEGFLEEQIFHLQIISYHYIQKKDFLTGAKILNTSLALLYQLPVFTDEHHLAIFERYLLARLEQIEAMFLKSKGLKPPINQTSLANYRNQLKEIRKESRAAEEKGRSIQQTLGNLTIAFKTLLSALIADAQNILGPPPVQWACMGMGSMSRDEMCPYSDVEFAFLLEKESTRALGYFRTLSQILELRIINLGETKFPVFGDKYPSPTPDGFCMDTGGNTPLGVTGVYELIGTPTTLAQFQKIQWMDRSIILPNALSHVCLVAGKEMLVTQYTKEKIKVQELIDKQAKSKEKNHKVLAMRLLDGHIKEFSPELSKEKEETSAFGIKKELYRPIQEIISSLALFYQLKTKTTFTRIDELVTLEVFSSKGAENLKKAITQVLALRLKAHLFYQNEEEFLCHPEEGKPFDPHLMYFDEETLQTLHEIYQVLIPFHQCGEKFLTSESKQTFKSSLFYDKSSTVQGAAFDKNLQYSKAQEMRQQAVSLNSNDVQALLHLGLIENKTGNSHDALPRNLKALEISRKKYGENHSNVATCYNNIGATYCTLGDNQKALEYHQKALKIWLQVSGENHPDVALSYNNIGAIYCKLGDYKKALEYLQKTLKINLQILGENHPDVANSYNNIGEVYGSLGVSEKALEYQQKALKIRLQVLGENHPDVATSYDHIGGVYRSLGDYEKALEYQQKGLKIGLQVLGENHPNVAASYNNISTIYCTLGDNQKALEYSQKSLKIRLQVLGENHLHVATIYNNIGGVYCKLGDYEKALEYYQKTLKIQCRTYKQSHPNILNALDCLIGVAEELQSSLPQLIKTLKPTYALCVETLGAEHELTKKLSQLIES